MPGTMDGVFSSALKSIEELEEVYNNLAKENEAVSKECQRLKQELELRQEKELELIRVKESESLLMKKIADYECEVAGLYSEIAKLDNDLKAKETKFEMLQTEKEITTQQLRDLKTTYEGKIASLEKESRNCRNREYEASNKYTRIKNAYEEMTREIENIKNNHKGVERQFREQLSTKYKQMEGEQRKKESDMKAMLESQKKMILMEVRSQFEEKISKYEELLRTYREKEHNSVANKSSENKKQLRVSINEHLNETSYFKDFSDEELSQGENEVGKQENNLRSSYKSISDVQSKSASKTKISQKGIPTMDFLDDAFSDSFSKKGNNANLNKDVSNKFPASETFDFDYFSMSSKLPISTPKASNASNKAKADECKGSSKQKKARLF